MILSALILAVAVGGMAALSAWLVRMRRMSLGSSIAVIAATTSVTGVAVALLVDRGAGGRSELVRSMDSVAWPVAADSPLVRATSSASAEPTGVQVSSVASMIGRLETRLAAQPDDPNGWALLAQSYAYTADADATERAIRRAVELGVDEPSLRERVEGAKRSAHPFGPPSVAGR